ncbi:hypothetical protein FRC01_010630 [Tulasnella sp. 417]|nr:hypothetical protein FRC01_010630 [Tulasnella sp. 417]
MVNRSLRPVCERALYRSISLPWHPCRSLRLLETFLLRPDLALLVWHLEIDHGCRYPFPPDEVSAVLQPVALKAIRLVKNIQSLSLDGVWIWKPEMAKFREAIFNLKLARLEVPFINDPHTERFCVIDVFDDDGQAGRWNGPTENWGGDLGNEIRRLLQAQPLLEEFKLSAMAISSTTMTSLRANLKATDVPSLKSLQASPYVAMPFLRVAPRLESLNLMRTSWNDALLSEMEINSVTIKASIRCITIAVLQSPLGRKWFWDNMAKVFSLFPNTEQLTVKINPLTLGRSVTSANYYFNAV